MTQPTANDNPERERSAKEIFAEAIKLPPDERAAFLEVSCAGNVTLRQKVDALIAAFDQVDDFMSAPTGGGGARIRPPADWADAGAARSGSHRASGADTDSQSTRLAQGQTGNEQVGQVLGRYKLLEKIGEGGFGTVWVAEQTKTVRRKVAIKIVKAGMDTREVLARFEAERQALAVMDHPNVARVFDAGATASGRPYFVMEFVPGVPITTYCDSARLKIRDRLGLFMDICSAVQHAHQKGVIHRDLKPGNILVTLLDGKPVPKVIDFGIAKATIGKLTEHSLYTEMGRLIGTPEYMAPEQAGTTGLDIDTRADIYSLGVLLYQLLTGTLPFDAATLRGAGIDGLARIIKEQEPPKPSTRLLTLTTEKVNRTKNATPETIRKTHDTDIRALTRELRGDLDWIVMKAIEKDRTRRYESASAFAADLQRHLTGEPVVAAPPSLAYRASKFVRKHRGPVTAVSAIGAVLIGATIGLTAMYRHARQNAREAEEQTRIAKSNESRAVEEFERAETAMASLEKERQRAELEEYIAKIGAAQLTMSVHSWPEARARLDSCPPNMRGWEWRYLRSKAEVIHLTLPGCSPTVSPDGKLVLTRSEDKTAKLWDADTGQQHGETMRHERSVNSAVFSPDGKLVLTASSDDTAKLWDADTGQQHGETMRHEDWVSGAVFSPDGKLVLTRSSDKTAKLWDADTGQQHGETMRHEGWVSGAVFSPDGKLVLTRSEDKTAKLWDADTGRQHGETMRHERSVNSAVFSRDGKLVLTRSSDKTAKLWDADTGRQHGETMRHERSVNSAVFSRDGKLVLTGSEDKTAKLWDADTGRQHGETMRHERSVNSAVFSRDGGEIITAENRTISTWDLSGALLDTYRTLTDANCPEIRLKAEAPFNFVFAEEYDQTRSYMLRLPLQDDPEKPLPALDLDIEIAHLMQSDPGTGTSNAFHGSETFSMSAVSPDGLRRVIANPDQSLRIFGRLPDQSALRGNPASLPAPEDRELAIIRLDRRPVGLSLSPDGAQLIVRLDDETAVVLDSRSPEARRADRVLRSDELRAAAPFVDDLLAKPEPPASELRQRIRGEPGVSPLRKLARLKQLDLRVAEINQKTNNVLASLKKKHLIAARVRAAAAAWDGDGHNTLTAFSARLHRDLIVQAGMWAPTGDELNSAAWEIVSDPTESPERVAAALEAVGQAAKQQPDDADILSTLGVAHYRAGNYPEAIEALEKSERQYAKGRNPEAPPTDPQEPVNWAFIAMSQMKLGRTAEAQTARERLVLLMKDPDNAEDDDYQAFLKEVEALVPNSPPWWMRQDEATTQPADGAQAAATQPATSQPDDASSKD
ncbi:MAG: protein kinase [Phycisphaerae bacterium]|nr:protein kinase [Phycisphaerae bacterium]